MCCSPHTKAFECTKYVYQNEGLRAFYRSYWTALSMNIPYQMAMVMSYGLVQRHFNPDGAYNPTIHFLAGAAAGGVASVVTMPLDVCKTLLNTQESAVLKQLNKVEVRGLRNAFKTVYGLRGFRGFFQGLMPRLLYQVGFIIYWVSQQVMDKHSGTQKVTIDASLFTFKQISLQFDERFSFEILL